MRDLNLFVLVIGGITLGGLIITMARDATDRPMRAWDFAAAFVLAVALMYGIEHLPNLGG